MKKTKIICTMGPACLNEEMLTNLMNAGMNVARVNCSHGTDEEHKKAFNIIKKAREKNEYPLGIMLDTKGPEYRIGTFANEKVKVDEGAEFTFTTDEVVGNEKIVSVSYKNLSKELKTGDKILVSNGLLEFEVVKIKNNNIICKTIAGGTLSNRKSMNFPNKIMKHEFLSQQDKQDLLIGIKSKVDFVACSFVSTAQNIIDIKNFLNENGGKNIKLIAKIENQLGIDNIDEILENCYGIMIGRGDLGVEVEQARLPAIQKYLINKCLQKGKIVITATEMLESMITNIRPTRAETSDVANAVYDGSTAIMLSAETAVGNHPLTVVKTMSKIAQETESAMNEIYEKLKINREVVTNLNAITRATVSIAQNVQAKVIVACSKTGKTIQSVSAFHSNVPILGLVTDKDAFYKTSLCFGTEPMLVKEYQKLIDLFENAKSIAIDKYNLTDGDKIVITGGTSRMENTNLVKLEEV